MIEVHERIEPVAKDGLAKALKLCQTEEQIVKAIDTAFVASIAISLKRIADTLGTLSTEPCNLYGETILPALTRAISDGIAGR